jgi:hypothetical protein
MYKAPLASGGLDTAASTQNMVPPFIPALAQSFKWINYSKRTGGVRDIELQFYCTKTKESSSIMLSKLCIGEKTCWVKPQDNHSWAYKLQSLNPVKLGNHWKELESSFTAPELYVCMWNKNSLIFKKVSSLLDFPDVISTTLAELRLVPKPMSFIIIEKSEIEARVEQKR